MGKILDQCCKDAWDIISGRKKIVRNVIVEVNESNPVHEDNQEYGWLAPDGKFYQVEFGNHQAWAAEYLLNLYRDGQLSYDEAKLEGNKNAGDVLADMGWMLIHNPTGTSIEITRNESKRISKAQKDFLYDFCLNHGMSKRAKELLEN